MTVNNLNQPKTILLCTKLWKPSPTCALLPASMLMQSPLKSDRSENWSSWTLIQRRKIDSFQLDQLPNLTLCAASRGQLAQRKPWLYIIYQNSSSTHCSFSHFEQELNSSLQFGSDAYAEALFVINKEIPIKKKWSNKKSSWGSWPVWLRFSSQTVLNSSHRLRRVFLC